MKAIVVLLTIGGVNTPAVIRTNDDGKCQRFTIMEVDKPAGLSENDFPFKRGTVYNYSDVLEILAMLGAQGKLTIVSVTKEDANAKASLTLPVIKKVQITVTNEGATLKIDGEVQPGLSWVGYLHKGESVTYSAELEGYNTDTDTLTVSTSDITKSITLVEA